MNRPIPKPRGTASRIVCILFALLGTVLGAAPDRSYWVWGRSKRLASDEIEELRMQKVSRLYWQVATGDGQSAPKVFGTASAEQAGSDPNWTVIPVVRVESRKVPAQRFFQALRSTSVIFQGRALQIDFDCPDRLLPEYAELLRTLRSTWPELSIGALTHWPTVRGFPDLAASVAELCPMFYDIDPEPTGVGPDHLPPAILDPRRVAPLFESWKTCPTPWRAGLPTFTRVTIFDSTGLSRGQIFDWAWEEMVFHPRLHLARNGENGVCLFRVGGRSQIAGRRLEPDEMLAVRWTDRAALQQAAELATTSGAMGTVLFRLGAVGNDSTWSLRGMRGDPGPEPTLVLKSQGDRLVLENVGSADLPARLAGERHDRDRGYELEIEAPGTFFREALPGEFYRVGAHLTSEGREPSRVGVSSATTITFWFSDLPAGRSLQSGLFQLAPSADSARLRWRIRGGTWQPLTFVP